MATNIAKLCNTMNLERIKKLQARLSVPLLVKKRENLFYLTGQWFMHGFLLVQPLSRKLGRSGEGVVFFGDGLEHAGGIKQFDRLKYLGKYLKKHSILQIEDEFTFAEYQYIKSQVKSQKLKVEPTKSPVDDQRMTKEFREIALVQQSMNIAGEVFTQVKKRLRQKAGTEWELAEFIKQAGLRLGAEDVSFPPIVASGPNAAIPHHIPGNRKLKSGESIILDFGFKYQGYCSDFTRTVFLNRVPKKLQPAYLQTQKAYEQSIQAVRSGLPASYVYKRSVEVLAEKGLNQYFIHNLGHGTGLAIHEPPNLSPLSKDVLGERMVFSIEPGVYLPGLGGIRIEDLVYLKEGKVKKFINQSINLEDNIL